VAHLVPTAVPRGGAEDPIRVERRPRRHVRVTSHEHHPGHAVPPSVLLQPSREHDGRPTVQRRCKLVYHDVRPTQEPRYRSLPPLPERKAAVRTICRVQQKKCHRAGAVSQTLSATSCIPGKMEGKMETRKHFPISSRFRPGEWTVAYQHVDDRARPRSAFPAPRLLTQGVA